MLTQSVDIKYAKSNLEDMIMSVEEENITFIITIDSIPKALLTNIS